MPFQAKAVCSKSIGFNNLSASVEVVVVKLPDQFRLRQVQLVIATVDKNPFGVEQRARGAVAQNGCLFQLLQEVSGHLYENTGSFTCLHGMEGIGCFGSHPRSQLDPIRQEFLWYNPGFLHLNLYPAWRSESQV